MDLSKFRIVNFRSIVDTGWCSLSGDGITCLIGQNEAGKSSILDAIESYQTKKIHNEDLRDDVRPEIHLEFTICEQFITDLNAQFFLSKAVQEYLKQNQTITLGASWSKDALESGMHQIISSDLSNDSTYDIEDEGLDNENAEKKKLDKKDLIELINQYLPYIIKFDNDSNMLPSSIKLSDLKSQNEAIKGLNGALNFLCVGDLEVEDLEIQDPRAFENKISRANTKVTNELLEFWKQNYSNNEISVSLKRENAGGLIEVQFWIKEGTENYYPIQRSAGLRWFLSFFLQLQAAIKSDHKSKPLFLIDEPASLLHEIAQKKVLDFFDRNKSMLSIVYSTHSPSMIDLNHLGRIMAVERTDSNDDQSQTKVTPYYKISSSSKDTLSPLYSIIGSTFASQTTIKQYDNVILEEPSAMHYFKAFWKLCSIETEAHFIPAQGVTNVSSLAHCFTGWGISFIIVVDDDKKARDEMSKIKEHLYGNKKELYEPIIMKLNSFHGIEDIFSAKDYSKHVLNDPSINISTGNSEYAKKNNRPKFLDSYNFYCKVIREEVSINDFENVSKDSIQKTCEAIQEKLSLNKNKSHH